MIIYYKDRLNNIHTINHNKDVGITGLCVVCKRDDKPISNKTIIIANDTTTYALQTDVYGFVGLSLPAGKYTITIDDYSCAREVIENVTTTVEINAQYSVFGLLYDDNNPDPEKSLSYCEDALLVDDWDTENLFATIKPCVFKDGKRQFYLNPNDLSKKENGEDIDISNSEIGDVMIEIPKIGVKFDIYDGKKRIQITNNPNLTNEGFHYYAHTRITEGDRDFLYVGAFLGSLINNQLRSLGSQDVLCRSDISSLRQYLRQQEGYDLLSFYPFVLLQILFILKYKSLNSQEILGMGYTSILNMTNTKTGTTYNKGMDFGESTGQQQMKFIGIEDLWGNNCCYIDGLFYNQNNSILTAYKNFNNNGQGYFNHNNGITNDIKGYLQQSIFSAEDGFLPLVATGDFYIYYSDNTQRASNSGIVIGGSYNDSYKAGLFASWLVANKQDISARLMYL